MVRVDVRISGAMNVAVAVAMAVGSRPITTTGCAAVRCWGRSVRGGRNIWVRQRLLPPRDHQTANGRGGEAAGDERSGAGALVEGTAPTITAYKYTAAVPLESAKTCIGGGEEIARVKGFLAAIAICVIEGIIARIVIIVEEIKRVLLFFDLCRLVEKSVACYSSSRGSTAAAAALLAEVATHPAALPPLLTRGLLGFDIGGYA